MISKTIRGLTINKPKPNVLPMPSLNEINYLVFGDASIYYFDELYSYIKENGLEAEMNKDPKCCKWLYKKIDEKTKKVLPGKKITFVEYIRHQIHHPENKMNRNYTIDDFNKSIEYMRNFLLLSKKRLVN